MAAAILKKIIIIRKLEVEADQYALVVEKKCNANMFYEFEIKQNENLNISSV